jgi:hypothetical protein
MIALKGILWLILGLSVYAIISGFFIFLKSSQANAFFSWVIILVLLLIGVKFCLSLLPGSIGKAMGKIGRMILRLLSLIAIRSLKVLWELLK